MNEKCKCGHTNMYHSVMGRCQHRGHNIAACQCIEFTSMSSLQLGYPVISSDPNKLVEYREVAEMFEAEDDNGAEAA